MKSMKCVLAFVLLCSVPSFSKIAGVGTIGLEYVFRILLYQRGGLLTGDAEVDFLNIAGKRPTGYTIPSAVVVVTPGVALTLVSQTLSCPDDGRIWEGDAQVSAGFKTKLLEASGKCYLILTGTHPTAATSDAGIVLKARLE